MTTMKTIKLNRMELRNFKGVVQAEYDFAEHTSITGANATGKSTIYEAYLWCLFDKNALGNAPKVQPLDANNEVKHQLVTSVKLYLDIDGNPMIAERSLQEELSKARGASQAVLKGTKNEYAVNEVPMSKTQFNQKLAEIMPLDRWFQISCVGIIPNMDQKTCRAALQAIAPSIDEREIASAFPAVLAAMDKGLNVDELAAMTKSSKKQAQEELESIPAALDAQDRLRVDEDWEKIEESIQQNDADIAEYKSKIEDLQRGLAGASKASEYMNENDKVLAEMALIESAASRVYNEKRSAIEVNLNKVMADARSLEYRIASDKRSAEMAENELNGLKATLSDYRTQWIAKNSEVYTEPKIENVCPLCGQPLPIDRVELARKSYSEWNTKKVAALNNLQKSAEIVKEQIDKVAKANELAIEAGKKDDAELAELNSKLDELQTEFNNIAPVADMLAVDAKYQELKSQHEALVLAIDVENAKSEASDVEARISELKERLNFTTTQRDSLLKELAGRDANKRIDAERARLECRQRDLGGLIAEYEGVEAQIAGFRKARITAVEEGVSRLFTMVHWKMYEPNVTNDGEKEICQAIIDGIPYEQQNNAMRINAGVDIVNGFAAAYGVCAPLFIDNAESVTSIIQTSGQSITLSVHANSTLKFAYNQ